MVAMNTEDWKAKTSAQAHRDEICQSEIQTSLVGSIGLSKEASRLQGAEVLGGGKNRRGTETEILEGMKIVCFSFLLAFLVATLLNFLISFSWCHIYL